MFFNFSRIVFSSRHDNSFFIISCAILQFSFLQCANNSAAESLAHCKKENCSIAQLMMKNELSWRDEKTIREKLKNIAQVMEECIHHGCISTVTILPGGLKVRRRAPSLYQKLQQKGDPKLEGTLLMEWLDLYAIAVNEE